MPLDHLLRPAPRRWFGLPRNVSAAIPVMIIAVLLSGQLILSALPQLCAAVRCCLLRRYIFFAVNFILLLLLLLKLTDRNFREEGAAAAAVSADEWFDALSSPTSFGDHVETEDKESTSTPPAASPLEPLGGVTAARESGFPVSFLAPSGVDVTTEVSGWSSSTTPASSLEPAGAGSSPGGGGSDEFFYSCPPTPSTSPHVSSDSAETAARGRPRKSEVFHAAAATRRAVPEKRLEGREPAVAKVSDEDADDSMDATWKAITGGASRATPHLTKSATWDSPPSVDGVQPAARSQQLRRSETLQLDAAAGAAGARRAVLEKRMRGVEVAMVVEDSDEMNRRFDTFIENFNEQLSLQRLASLRRRRYMDTNVFYHA